MNQSAAQSPESVDSPSDDAARRPAWQQLLWGLPAVVMLLATAWIVFVPLDRQQVAQRYRNLGRQALDEQNFEWALLCYQKVVESGQASPQVLYEKALALEGLGRLKIAQAEMQKLADRNPPFILAHRWLAKHVLDQQNASPQQLGDVVEGLRRCLEAEPDHLEIHRWMALVLARRGDLQASIPHWQQLAPRSLEARLHLARIHDELGNQDQAREYADSVRQAALSLIQQQPQNAVLPLLANEAARLLGDFAAAIDVLKDARQRISSQATLDRALSATYFDWAASQAATDRGREIQLLLISTQYSPVYPPTWRRLFELVEQPGDEMAPLKEALRQAEELGVQPKVVHLLLARLDQLNSGSDSAASHWQQALAGDEAAALVTDAAAALLARDDKTAAKRLLDDVLKRQPDWWKMRLLRSQLHLDAKRPREALEDLVAAAELQPKNWQIPLLQAQAYDQLGDPKAAFEHRKEAQALRDAAVEE